MEGSCLGLREARRARRQRGAVHDFDHFGRRAFKGAELGRNPICAEL